MKIFSLLSLMFFISCISSSEPSQEKVSEAEENAEGEVSEEEEAGISNDEEKPPTKRVGRRIVPRLLHVANLKAFIQDNLAVHQSYGELKKEFFFYSNILSGEVPPSDSDFNIVKLRVKENPERAHWAFVYGLYELQNEMLKHKKYLLVTDKEKVFVEKMRVLVFLAEEMHNVEGNNWYVGSLSKIYRRINEKEFRRIVEPKNKEPKNGLDLESDDY